MASDDDGRDRSRSADEEDPQRTRSDVNPRAAGPGVSDAVLRAVTAGQVDRYRLEGRIASGGMGSIESAVDETLLRRTAMKRIHEDLQQDARSVRMFVREARVVGHLQHPNVVPVHELGIDSDGRLYFTMKLVEGRTVKQLIAELDSGPIERQRLLDLLDVVVRVCDALAYAHSLGIVHCDIKPSNVMVGEFGQVYLMDWGVAYVLPDSKARAEGVLDVDEERHQYIAGTPTHMAPEQAAGAPVDGRADVFAVGAFLYNIVTRRPPYEADGFVQATARASLGAYPRIAEVVAEGVVPPALVAIIERAMEHERDRRYPTIGALRDDLVRFMRGGETFPRREIAEGEDVVREGEPGDAAYIIESGRCEVHRTVDGVRTAIREMGPGDVFGETAILSPGARTATVTALEPTTVLVVTAETLETEVSSMKPWMGRFVRTLAERFRERDAGE